MRELDCDSGYVETWKRTSQQKSVYDFAATLTKNLTSTFFDDNSHEKSIISAARNNHNISIMLHVEVLLMWQ